MVNDLRSKSDLCSMQAAIHGHHQARYYNINLVPYPSSALFTLNDFRFKIARWNAQKGLALECFTWIFLDTMMYLYRAILILQLPGQLWCKAITRLRAESRMKMLNISSRNQKKKLLYCKYFELFIMLIYELLNMSCCILIERLVTIYV
jgi:hypothetical protein